jgi:quinol monooxygenase YgiN
MIVVNVYIKTYPESIEAFKNATLENARNSINEPGIARFDFIQQNDDSTNFLLVEVYRDEDSMMAHKQTSHYAKWRQAVENMMFQPRKSVRYNTLFPEDKNW